MGGYLIDVNLPRNFQIWHRPDVVFVHDIGATWTDSEIWAYAKAHGLTIVSKDADFSHRLLTDRSGPRLIHFRIGNMRIREFHTLITRIWPQIEAATQTASLVNVYRDRIEIVE